MGHVDAPSLAGRRAQLHHLARVAPRVREVGETGRESNGALLDTLLDEPLRLLQRRPSERLILEAQGLQPYGAVGDAVGGVDRYLAVVV